MFGVVPKPLWETDRRRRRAQPHHAGDAAADRPRRAHDDHRRGARRQGERRVPRHLRRRSRAAPRPRAGRGGPRAGGRSTSSSPRHLHFDHAGGFTVRDAAGRCARGFPRAQYIVRRGEWDDATHPHERNRASYLADNFVPLADAGVLQLVDDDQTIMPGVRVRRTGGHTMHHQMVLIESGGKTAAFVGRPDADDRARAGSVDHGLRPVSDGHARAQRSSSRKKPSSASILVFFEHDPAWPPATSGRRTASASSCQRRVSAQCTMDARRVPGRVMPEKPMSIDDRHHRRQRPVRHGGADRPRGEARSTRRSATRPGRTWSGRCAASASPFWRGTASATAFCRPS